MIKVKKIVLCIIALVFVAASCSLEEPVNDNATGNEIEFCAIKQRIITKSGDDSQMFPSGTKFNLFAVGTDTEWSAQETKFYNQIGISDEDGNVDYSIDGKKASYDIDQNLDFYGLTYNSSQEVNIIGEKGEIPVVNLSLSANQFPDLMYSDNLKNKNSSSGILNMEFRHTLSKLKFEVLKQDESADADKKLENVVLKKVVLKGSANHAQFNLGNQSWSYGAADIADRIVYENAEGLKIEKKVQTLKDGTSDLEMLVVPNSSEIILEVTVDLDGNNSTNDDVVKEYKIMNSETEILKMAKGYAYTLSIAVLKNDVRIVTVTPRVYEWIDVEMEDGDIYLGQPVFFANLMWMDRNLGAKSADCENDWYNTVGYYYQHGRNIPYIMDTQIWREKYNKAGNLSFSGGKFNNNLIYTLDSNGEKFYGYQSASNSASAVHLYDNVAINPGDAGTYDFICGFSGASAWARGTDNKEDPRNHIFWETIENQPCPKGWRLPTRKDLYKYMPDAFKSTAVWQDSYTKGNNLNNDYHSGSQNGIGEVYDWKYFTAKFKVDTSSEEEYSYPLPDEFSCVYLIKYEGTPSAYRVMIEQRKANTDDPATAPVKMYVRISRFETTKDDKFIMDPTRTKWNLHKFDWENPAEFMDFPLCGYIDANTPFLNDFGDGCILRAMETDLSGNKVGRNWTIYLRNEHQGVTVGGNSRRSLGDQIRCVRDVNVEW